MEKKYFPIKTETACQLKWSWSTLYLNTGVTRSCHRTAESRLTPENFFDFHNTPLKISDRERMLQGLWPDTNCNYCREIEQRGGVSDRIRMSSVTNLSPDKLYDDPTATKVDPTLVEVYFNNTCNLGCVYCHPYLSSVIEFENRKHGEFKQSGVNLPVVNGNFQDLVPYFWQWFDQGWRNIKRLHVLGGEPFYQKEFDVLLEKINNNPNPDCELSITTNLMLSKEKLLSYIDKLKSLLVNRAVRRVDITCSIDCWGSEQEYVRWGLKLDQWKNNFDSLLENKWLTININQTITVLTIKTMPQLLIKLNEWKQIHNVGHFFSEGEPLIECLEIDLLGHEVFRQDIIDILTLMPADTDQDRLGRDYMQGILSKIQNSQPDLRRMQDLKIFLDEKDRRRGTNWKTVFPWIEKEFKKCGIVE